MLSAFVFGPVCNSGVGLRDSAVVERGSRNCLTCVSTLLPWAHCFLWRSSGPTSLCLVFHLLSMCQMVPTLRSHPINQCTMTRVALKLCSAMVVPLWARCVAVFMHPRALEGIHAVGVYT